MAKLLTGDEGCRTCGLTFEQGADANHVFRLWCSVDEVRLLAREQPGCDVCGSRLGVEYLNPAECARRIPPGLTSELWTSEDDVMVVGGTALNALEGSGLAVLSEGIPGTPWHILHATGTVEVEDGSTRRPGDARCPACGAYTDGELLRVPVVCTQPEAGHGLLTTTRMFGAGMDRGPFEVFAYAAFEALASRLGGPPPAMVFHTSA